MRSKMRRSFEKKYALSARFIIKQKSYIAKEFM